MVSRISSINSIIAFHCSTSNSWASKVTNGYDHLSYEKIVDGPTNISQGFANRHFRFFVVNSPIVKDDFEATQTSKSRQRRCSRISRCICFVKVLLPLQLKPKTWKTACAVAFLLNATGNTPPEITTAGT